MQRPNRRTIALLLLASLLSASLLTYAGTIYGQAAGHRFYIPMVRREAAPPAKPTRTPTATRAPATPTATRAPATPTRTATATKVPATPTATAPLPTATATSTSVPNPTGPDFTIGALEVTQAVQTNTNSVPLVAGRATVVRIYARNAGLASTSSVPVQLSATRAGAPLPGSPLLTAARVVPASPTRGDYASSYNITLPAEWAAGSVALTAIIDPQSAVAESNEGNNQAGLNITFNAVPALNITIVPVRYTHQPSGAVYAAPTQDRIGGWLRRAFPVSAVNVSIRSAIDFGGNLQAGADWSRLLDTTATLKDSDGAPASQVYYALVPTGTNDTTWVNLQGFIAGIGYVGARASVGLDYGFGQADSAGQIAGHEVGHNLGRWHAPCGTSSGVDGSYPYAGASIGANVYGLDQSTGKVWSPGAPDTAKDLMSYCRPKWLSDYNYVAIYNALRASPALEPAAGQGWLVRASFDAQGQPALLPLYALDAPIEAAPASSDYTVALFDAAGQLIGEYPVALRDLHSDAEARSAHPLLAAQQPEQPIALRAIHAVIPRADRAVAELRLLHRGQAVATQRLAGGPPQGAAPADLAASATQVTLRWPGGAPALVRFSADGQRWTTLAVDARGGALTIARAALPAQAGTFEILPAGAPAPLRMRL